VAWSYLEAEELLTETTPYRRYLMIGDRVETSVNLPVNLKHYAREERSHPRTASVPGGTIEKWVPYRHLVPLAQTGHANSKAPTLSDLELVRGGFSAA